MSIRNVVLLVAALLVAVFAGANWEQFSAPVTLDLIIREYEAPFGVVMLGVLAFFGALFLISVGGIKTSALKRSLAASKEVEAAHRVLTETEEGRIGRLEDVVRDRLGTIEAKLDRIAEQLNRQAARRSREEGSVKEAVRAGPT